ncbi:hypothetical protein JX265_009954 [Neoarthrinium moseri]|uniref:Uncharacterized protein n=1 Tax=Neoarthrinium moseri TaxID=1658444 RepID=A0A9Q0AKX6_9PEZI|nr:hypothetical protein JX265_009954 [Neoarthrinium moseri]
MRASVFRSASLAALCSGFLGCQALQGWPKQGTIVQGNAVQFDQATWERNLAKPNSTGSFPVSGFDISKNYSSQTIDGWRLSVNVSSGIPDSETLNPGNGSGQVFTGTSIFLQAPRDVVNNIDSDQSTTLDTPWKICVTVVSNGPQVDPSTADNGTCSGFSSQCISDLQQAFADKFAENQDCYRLPPDPASCGSAFNSGNLTTQQFPISYANGTEIFATASDAHDSSNTTAYDAAVRTEWPVLVVWGWNIRAHVSGDQKPTVQLTCIRANEAVSGTNTSSSQSLPRASPIIAVSVAIAVGLMLF